MKVCKLILFILFITLPLSCEKEVEVLIDFQSEIQEGAWRFQKVVDNQNEIVINGLREPTMLFFFLENNIMKGRLKGTYNLEEDSLSIDAQIDSLVLVLWAEYDELSSFPYPYNELEDIFKNGIDGKVEFFENGWDSEFSFQYAANRIMWFKRY